MYTLPAPVVFTAAVQAPGAAVKVEHLELLQRNL